MSIFADEFKDMMANTVTVERLTGWDDAGKPTYGAPVTYPALVDGKQHNIIGKDNQLVVARGTAYIDTVETITANDRLTMDDGSHPIVLLVNVLPDESGPAGTVIDFQ